MDREETLWRQYNQAVELYKFYLDIIVKFNVFFYAVTGAILSFYFVNQSRPDVKYALLLPLLMSVSFAGLFIYGALLVKPLRVEVFAIRDALQLKTAPEVGVLAVMLYIFAAVFLIVAGGCAFILWKY